MQHKRRASDQIVQVLEPRILNRLQTVRSGQTLAQLKTYLEEPRESFILTALMEMQRNKQVTQSKDGVWRLAREE
jgi:hypothetical protein